MEYKLVFKWGISKGRDTYGYTNCVLWVNEKKVAMCNGGGYDMQGTIFGNWVANNFKEELNELKIPMNKRNDKNIQEYYGLSFHDPNYDPNNEIINGETVKEREKAGKSIGLERYQSFYKKSSNIPTERHTIPSINGACGFSSVEKIIKGLGYKLKYIDSSAKQTIYLLIKGE